MSPGKKIKAFNAKDAEEEINIGGSSSYQESNVFHHRVTEVTEKTWTRNATKTKVKVLSRP